MSNVYDPEGRLNNVLTGWIQLYEGDFRQYWGLDGDSPPEGLDTEEWKLAKLWHEVAVKFFAAIRSLEKQEAGLSTELMIRVMEQTEVKNLIEQVVEIELAKDFEDELLRMTRRAIQLLDLLVTTKNPVAKSYLQRVADCYIRGLQVETVVMCGAVLEAALEDSTEDEEIRAELGWNKEHISPAKRIEYLKTRKILSSQQAKRAWGISEARNAAVHLRLESVPDSFETVSDLAVVLRSLEPPTWEK